MHSFPHDFLWGAATSAYQVEGSPLADGAGPSIWHRFAHTRGKVMNGDTGDVACDHYRRYKEDVRIMSELRLKTYRFSISWSRILPEGRGPVNPKGLAFYDRLVDTLLQHDIRPNATLYHWDLPAALDERGGWLNPDIAGWFADYARVVFDALDDRVPMWATLNEPWVVMDGGYRSGFLAPGHSSMFEAARSAHNLLRAHARAVEVYRTVGRGEIGLVVNLEPQYPASEEDRTAAARADAYFNRFFLDPVFFGSYPEELKEIFGEAWIDPPSDEMDAIKTPIEFLGINYYKRGVVAADPTEYPVHAPNLPTGARYVPQPREVHTLLDWPVYPDGLKDILLWVTDRYGRPPLYVTENGATYYDPPSANGSVIDPLRLDYIRRHLIAAHEAIQKGADLRGYYAWSLLDNLEWSQGFSKRFGLVHVDFETQERTVKESGRFYSRVIETNGAVLFD